VAIRHGHESAAGLGCWRPSRADASCARVATRSGLFRGLPSVPCREVLADMVTPSVAGSYMSS